MSVLSIVDVLSSYMSLVNHRFGTVEALKRLRSQKKVVVGMSLKMPSLIFWFARSLISLIKVKSKKIVCRSS